MLQSVYGKLTDIHSSAQNPLGAEYSPDGGKNVYKYLKGVASTLVRDLVKFDENFQTTRLVADATGFVAVAMAAVVANKYGWYQVKGNASVNSDTTAADVALYIDGTAGRCDDLVVTGDLIIGMYSMSADASNVLAVYMNHPHVTNILG